MKIIHVENYFDPTAGYQINELLIAGREMNDEVYLITSKDMSPFHKKVNLEKDRDFEKTTGVKIIRLETRLKLFQRVILKKFKKTVLDIKPDILFIHGIGDFYDFLLWGKRNNLTIIRDCHMSWVASKNKFRHFFYFFYRIFFAPIINKTDKYDVIYALGQEEYEYLLNLGINNNKIDFLLHGYNNSIMYYDSEARKKIRNKYKFENDDIIISYIGKFNRSKRPDLLFDIINNFKDKYLVDNNIKLLFVGPKDEEYMVNFSKKANKIKNKVKIIIDDSKPFYELREYFSASDICIFPKETTLSSLHAQVCGCPVIMENHKSNQERVINNKNLYEPNELEQAVDIIKRIIYKREYIKKLDNISILKQREYKSQLKDIKKRNK